MPHDDRILDIDIAEVMRDKYREYANAVVVSRALPDVRDGLKPVHRRILYVMFGGYDWTKPHSKSARVVGDVMGRLHPHGDSAIYDAMARLAQPWSLSAMLVDGQGNFGSPDGDPPAAMRYTEARLAPIAKHLVDGIRENTVPFMPNYDGKEEEPSVLPAAFPNVLVNGGSGIAVGMGSSIPTHNLGEVIDATLLRMRAPHCSLEEVMTVLPGPDFPTGARMLGTEGVARAYETGRGGLILEATTTPDKNGRIPILVYTDMPWKVSKETLLVRIKELIASGAVPEITSARDETGRTGTRFVVETKPGSDLARVDAILKDQTDLRASVPVNMTLLDQHGVPREMGLLAILDAWIGFRRITVRRRFNFELGHLRDRGRLLVGRMAALSALDKVIRLIRDSADRSGARAALLSLSFPTEAFSSYMETLGTRAQRKSKRFALSQEQADHILEMRLQRLTGLEREALAEEGDRILARMRDLLAILSDPERLDALIMDELRAIRAAHAIPRRTEIAAAPEGGRLRIAPPPVKREAVRVLIDAEGAMIRAGRSDPGPFVREILTDTHSRLVAFMRHGHAYSVAVTDLPSADAKEPFRSLTGILGARIEGEVAEIIALNPEADAEAVLAFVSPDGAVRRTPAAEFFRMPQAGKSAMGIGPDDPPLLTVIKETPGGGALFMGTAEGRVIRFSLSDLRVMAGRSSRGVRGMTLSEGDRVVSAFELPDLSLTPEVCDAVEAGWLGKRQPADELTRNLMSGPEIVQVSETGYAKRTIAAAYRQTGRGNRGVNDRGPAKGIGRMRAWVLAGEGAESARLPAIVGQTDVLMADLPKRGRAATGEVKTSLA